MQTEQIKLSRIRSNTGNPRTITSDRFNRLVDSILVFPKMLELRPIVHDGKFTVLGGNQRRQALVTISKMTPEQLAQRLSTLDDYRRKTEGERRWLVEWWGNWLEGPFAYVVSAADLSEEERRQFVIKDNVSYGSWDYDMLANAWDSTKLGDWGVNVWDSSKTVQGAPGATNEPGGKTSDRQSGSEQRKGQEKEQEQITDTGGRAAMDSLTIAYRPEQRGELERMLGIRIRKSAYTFNEIRNNQHKD